MKPHTKLNRRGVFSAMAVPGAASSASKYSKVVGMKMRGDRVWVEGEGWVKWSVIERQVREKFEAWRIKKSLQGAIIRDGAEAMFSDMIEGVERKRKQAVELQCAA